MKKEIYKAAVRGDVEFLKEAKAKDVEAAVAVYNDNDLLGLTYHGNNIIHVAAEHEQLDFIKAALECFPAASDRRKLICGTNSNEDTPLHMAANQETETIAEHLISSYNQILHCDGGGIPITSPCRIQNKQGNTPLHVSLMNGGKSIQVAAYLLRVDSEVASFSNNRKQTPLHLAVQYNNQDSKTSMTKMMNTLNGLGASSNYTKSHFEEDSLSLVELLLKSAPEVCCLPDEDGMTPLIRAALNSYLGEVEAIIDYCPESVEICDSKGRNILHHIKLPSFLDARKFLSTPEICALMDRQDEDGYTPLHIAIMNCDSNMLKAMIERNANFATKNKEGTSPAALILSESSSFLDKVKLDFRKGCTNQDDLMTKNLFEAVGYSKWESLRRKLKAADSREKYFLTRLPDGSNIAHVAVENCPFLYHESFDNSNEETSLEMFVLEALNKFPILSCHTNFHGETPIHASTNKRMFKPDGMPFTLLKQLLRQIKDQILCFPLPPWEVKDTDGNSLLHLAIKWNRFEFAEYIIEELDAKLVGELNNSKETPLHMLCRYGPRKTKAVKRDDDMVDFLIKKDVTTVYICDADGFTPLLRAVQRHRLKIAARILHHCPQSIKQNDSQFGRGIFHVISFNRKDDMIQDLCEIPQKKYLMTFCDHNFNTPLHIAIEQRRFGTIKILMEHLDDTLNYRAVNTDGKTVINVLASLQNTPRWFQDFLSSKWMDLPGLIGTGRSIYGIHHSDLKEYMGTIGLVAALLTTITFTAAFTVPGGYNSDKGTPILARRVAFHVFMFANVVGMCSSIMVLSCLIWFLSSGQVENEGSTLVDLSVGLLQLAFTTTLISFMSGVYATAVDDTHQLAIFTCVLCSVVFLLMRKRLILDFLVPMFWVLYFLSELCTLCLTASSKWIARSLASWIKGIIRCIGGQQPSAR